MIIGVVGRSVDPTGAMCSLGTGKDTVADLLVNTHKFQKIGMADPLKRFTKEVYGFTDEQLWGPSKFRNIPDERYPREEHIWKLMECKDYAPYMYECECCGAQVKGDTRKAAQGQCYLTPRFALQQLGTQWGRYCWDDTWIKIGVNTARDLMENTMHITEQQYMMYTPQEGLVAKVEQTSMGEWTRDDAPKHNMEGVVFSDVRFKNELKCIREAGGKILLVHRKVDEVAASAKDRAHQSENDLNEYPDSSDFWDEVIYNTGTLEALGRMTQQAVGTLLGVATIAD